jgi:hypothetical protein
MDPHVRWLRGRIVRSLAQGAAAAYPGAFLLSLVCLRGATGASFLVAVPWAALSAQCLVAGAVVWAAFTNPLDVRYLRSRLARPRMLAVAPSTSQAAAALEPLAGHELTALATVWDTTDAPQPLFDLFQTPRASVTVARHRATDACSVLSRLDDGRILVTDTVRTAPHRRLVLNQAHAGDLGSLLASHLEGIGLLRQIGRTVEAADANLFVEFHAIEQVALQTLGPVLGPFYNPTLRPAPARFLARIGADELLGLALDPALSPVRPAVEEPSRRPA